jgi:hypothetical protein
VACVAGQGATAAKVRFVHALHHSDHPARRTFAWNVFGELIEVLQALSHMAAGAVQARAAEKNPIVSMN